MKIIAVDDEELVLKLLVTAIGEAVPEAEILAFDDAAELLAFANENTFDIAFLDINLRGKSGIDVARELKQYNPKVNLIFVTGYMDYANDAFSIYASGYVMKPVTKEKILKEMQNLRYPLNKKKTSRVFVQCFGNFEVFVNGIPLTFHRSKAKELFAFLVDRNGGSVRTSEIAAVIWEEKEYGRSLRNTVTSTISYMMQDLKAAGIEDVIIKNWNSIAINTDSLECDYYDLLKGELWASQAFHGEYLKNYSWAEETTGWLDDNKNNRKGNMPV